MHLHRHKMAQGHNFTSADLWLPTEGRQWPDSRRLDLPDERDLEFYVGVWSQKTHSKGAAHSAHAQCPSSRHLHLAHEGSPTNTNDFISWKYLAALFCSPSREKAMDLDVGVAWTMSITYRGGELA